MENGGKTAANLSSSCLPEALCIFSGNLLTYCHLAEAANQAGKAR